MQDDTTIEVDFMKKGSKEIENGTLIVNQAGESFMVLEDIQDVSD